MAEATWQLRQRPRTLDRRVPGWCGARGEVGRCLWAWSIRLSIKCPAGTEFAPLHGSVDGYMVTPNGEVERPRAGGSSATRAHTIAKRACGAPTTEPHGPLQPI